MQMIDVDDARRVALECAVGMAAAVFPFDSGHEINVEVYLQSFWQYLSSDHHACALPLKACALKEACRIKEAAVKKYSNKSFGAVEDILETAQALQAWLALHDTPEI